MNPANLLRSVLKFWPVISPQLAMARGAVLSQPGREKSVYVDPRRTNPWVPAGVEAVPVITPSLLMPAAVTANPQMTNYSSPLTALPDRKASCETC